MPIGDVNYDLRNKRKHFSRSWNIFRFHHDLHAGQSQKRLAEPTRRKGEAAVMREGQIQAAGQELHDNASTLTQQLEK